MPMSRTSGVSLERQLELIRYALDKSAIVAITDRTGKIVHVNDRFCEISKYSRAELLGQNHRIINSGYHGKEFFTHMWRTIASGQVWEGEVRNRAKDGSYYWVNTTIVPFLDDDGKPFEYVSIRYDITQRKLAEEKLRNFADELEHKNRDLSASVKKVLDRESQIVMQDRLASVGLLASSLAHEIGTPLGVIRGRAEYLEMRLRDNPDAVKTAGVIVSQIDRVSKLIRSLLNLARGDNRHVVEAVRPKWIFNELGELLSHDLRKASVELKVELPEELAVMAESGPLQQVLLNLLVNAVHAIQAVPAEARRPFFIRVFAEERAGGVALSIEDNGTGISLENQKKLFQPFFTTKDIGKGTGLGLATSYRIVESWGGRIDVRSEPGKGTVFTLQLAHASGPNA
jgi:PAS domain S-box-containing protein